MRWAMLLLTGAVLLSGCDKGAGGNRQAAAPAPVANAAGPSPDEMTEAEADAAVGNIVTTDNGAAPAAPGKVDRGHVGQAPPATTFADPDGKPITLATFGGKPFLVNLWATYCAPCVAEMPALDRLAAGGVNVVAISQDVDGRRQVDPFFAKIGVKTLKPYTDPQLTMSVAYQAQLPTSIFYDGKGREVWRVSGDMDWGSAAAKKLLAEGR